MGQAALVAQLHALMDAETVLLVDDGEREFLEFDTRLEQRMGTHRHQVAAVLDRRETRAPLCDALPTGEQPDADTERREPGTQGLEVLFGENLRGCHDRGLAAVLGRADGGEGGDDRLAGADVALQQAHHRASPGKVVQHVSGHPGLGAGEAEAECVQQRAAQFGSRGERHGGLLVEQGMTALHHQEVAGQLVERHPFARGLQPRRVGLAGVAGRSMEMADRVHQVGEVVIRQTACFHLSATFKRRGHPFADPGGGKAQGRGVDRG